jgi:carbon monoxide dehydrogenase subunit G
VKLEGTRTFSAPRSTVWAVLNDPAQMAELMPGVESFEVRDERHWVAKVKIPLGLGGLKMSINFDRLEQREPEFARLAAKGTGVGALMNMETAFHLDEADGGTAMRWEADVQIAGPVGAMGQRVLQPIVNQQVSSVLNALDRQVQRAATSDAGAQSAAGDTSDSSGPSTGAAGTTEPRTEGVEPRTDPQLKDEGAPAEPRPEADPADEAGSSGAEEGVSPWSPEAYDEEPEGPTKSTEDRS